VVHARGLKRSSEFETTEQAELRFRTLLTEDDTRMLSSSRDTRPAR